MNKTELIEKAIRETLVISNPESIHHAVRKIADLLRVLDEKPIPPDAIWDLEIRNELEAPTHWVHKIEFKSVYNLNNSEIIPVLASRIKYLPQPTKTNKP